MYEAFGAVVDGAAVEFQLFFPNATQYVRGGDPGFRSVRVAGTFQQTPWDYESAPRLTATQRAEGTVWSHRVEGLADGYYEYKYVVDFDGERRWCSDPCGKHGTPNSDGSAFVIGGHDVAVQPIGTRLPLRDLVIYELMLDDFTDEYRGTRAPLDAVRDRLDYLQTLGVNAIEFMPWTAWPGSGFSWGYDPFAFFAVEHRLFHDPAQPLDKLFLLKRLINELHARGMHVIMDGVFNHAWAERYEQGFAYYWLYRDPSQSPFVGSFGEGGYFRELDFSNACTSQFIADVCRHWLDVYRIDGIRFDYVRGFYRPGSASGIAEVIQQLRPYAQEGVSFTLEYLPENRYLAIDATNQIGATGCWFDQLMFELWNAARDGRTRPSLMRALDAAKDFGPGRCAVTYIENHDHSTAAVAVGGNEVWYRTQPAAIALLTVAGAPMIHNGQEFADHYSLPHSGDARVLPRPVHWALLDTRDGRALFDIYAKLIAIRKARPALRSPNFENYGVEENRGIAIFRRWDDREEFVIVLNFSANDHTVSIPFPRTGVWKDLLDGDRIDVHGARMERVVTSHWGQIWFCAAG